MKVGVNLILFVKLVFEIAVDQETKTSDQTFKGSQGAAIPIFVPFLTQLCQIPSTQQQYVVGEG